MLFFLLVLLKQNQIEFGLNELKTESCSWQAVDTEYVCREGKRVKVKKNGKEGKNIFFVFFCHMTFDESDSIFCKRLHVWIWPKF